MINPPQKHDGNLPWLSLLRLPNILTVPGDAIVGFILVMPFHQGGLLQLISAIIAGLCFYAAGLVMNDLVDVEKDRVERPGRPLASGAISLRAAKIATAALLAAALVMVGISGVLPLIAGMALGSLIFIYNLYARRNRFFGSLTMGLCRAGSVALGAACALPFSWPGWELVFILGWWTTFIGVVAWLASREVINAAYNQTRWLPMVVLAGGGLYILFFSAQQNPQSLFRAVFGMAFCMLLTYYAALRLGTPMHVRSPVGRVKELDAAKIFPPAIGLLISTLIPLQASMLILMSNEPWVLLAALLLLISWPINRWLAGHFAAS